MKKTQIMAVLAVFLVAALCIGAVSAAATPRDVAAGDDNAGPVVYVNETVNVSIVGTALTDATSFTLSGLTNTSSIIVSATEAYVVFDLTGATTGNSQMVPVGGSASITAANSYVEIEALTVTPGAASYNVGDDVTATAGATNTVETVTLEYNGVEQTIDVDNTAEATFGPAVTGVTDITIASFASPVAAITVTSTSNADINNFTAVPDATEIATGSQVTIDINATKTLTTPVWVSWGDGTIEELDFSGSMNLSKSHTYLLADRYPVIVMNGPTPDQSTGLKTVSTITVTGTAGEITVDMPITAAQGSTVLITFTSMGVVQPDDVTVEFGDGITKTEPFSAITGGFEAVVDNIYADVGTYTVNYTIDGTTSEAGDILITPAEYRYIQITGEDVFVYEHIDVATLDSDATKLTKYSDGAVPSAVNIIAGTDGKFYLTEEVVNGQYGKYVIDDGVTGANFVYIWYPELSLQAELTQNSETGATAGDSIDGKNVNKDTEITFLINAPKVGPAFKGAATAKIVFTTPASGKTTTFGTGIYAEPFGDVPLKAAQTIAGWTQAGDDATAGTWTAQAEYKSPKAFADYAKKSNTISFTLQSSTLTITAAKDSVVRSNPFTVTISGKAQTVYAVYLENAVESDVNPSLQPNQNGWQTGTNVVLGDSVIGADFKTDASGKRTIQYNTEANTEDKTYTVRVDSLTDSDYDKVKVKVEKGAVTISASGDGSYYIGDEIKLTGTNTDSSNIFLFLTGQNLKANGIVLKWLPDKFDAYTATNPVPVKTDNTWEYKWDTSEIALDTGAYTVYATSRLTNGKSSDAIKTDSTYGEKDLKGDYWAVKLSDSEYATVSVNLKQPFLSAVPSGTVIAQGDKLYVRGTAEGKPNNLKLYIFGPNFFEPYTITVEDDGTYEKKIDIGSSWASNQYFVVVQHPMYNGVFDAELKGSKETNYMYFEINNVTTGGSQQGSFVVWGQNKLQGSQAADALTKMIDDANIDDIYTKLTFTVAAPWIRIASPGDKAVGSKFTITGTTNLAVDDQILVEVVSSSFTASDKTQTNTNSGVSQTTKVVKGDSDNTWSVDVDTTNWKLDQYTIKVNGIEVDVTTTTDFNLVEKVVTTVPTTSATTAVPTGATSVPTTTPTKTPGFGAFIALAGLGAVALLVLRRN